MVNEKRKEIVNESLRAIENLESLIFLTVGEGRPDFRERLSAMRDALESADCKDPRTDELIQGFLDLQDEILRTLVRQGGEVRGYENINRLPQKYVRLPMKLINMLQCGGVISWVF